jgi:hypothetical protein
MLRLLGFSLAAVIAFQGAPAGPTGDLSGSVRDAGGSVLPGAMVTAQTGTENKVTSTNTSGRYECHHLPVGTYQVTALLSGFQPSVRSDVRVSARAVVEVDFALKIREQRFVDPVWTFIEPFVVGDAVACGTYQRLATVVAPNRSLECGLQAVRDGRAFWTVREWPGVDSSLAHGLLGRRDGKVFVFDYDSAPCGGISCVPTFTIQRCPAPAVSGGGVEVKFTCNPEAWGLLPGAYSRSTASGSTRAARREGR